MNWLIKSIQWRRQQLNSLHFSIQFHQFKRKTFLFSLIHWIREVRELNGLIKKDIITVLDCTNRYCKWFGCFEDLTQYKPTPNYCYNIHWFQLSSISYINKLKSIQFSCSIIQKLNKGAHSSFLQFLFNAKEIDWKEEVGP